MYKQGTIMARSFKKMANIFILSVFTLSLLLANANFAQASEVSINSFEVSPSVFNPNIEDLYVNFDVNQSGYVVIDVFNSNTRVGNIAFNEPVPGGPSIATWDGVGLNGSTLPAGTYKVQLYFTDDVTNAFAEKYITVDYSKTDPSDPPDDPDPNPPTDVIGSHEARPSPFNPNFGGTKVYFALRQASYVTVTVDINGTDKVILNNKLKGIGTWYASWDGTDNGGNKVSAGVYPYTIVASVNGEQETGYVSVEYNTTEDVVISDYHLSKVEFDPHENEDTRIYYHLNTCAYTSIDVFRKSNDEFIKNLKLNEYECAGYYDDVEWDGTNESDVIVENGDFDIVITAVNAVSDDSDVETVKVDEDSGGGSGSGPHITDVDLTDYVFDPDDYEDTELSYRLDECADVTIRVYDDNDEEVYELDYDDYQCSGEHTYNWDGEDEDNDVVDDGDYYFEIYAENDDGDDTETVWVEVDTDGSGNDDDPEITRVDVYPDVFDPDEEDTELSFRLNTCADVTIEVRDDRDRLVYEIIDDRRLCSGTHDYTWDGEDEDGYEVDEDIYEFYIRAENSDGTDTARADVEVDYDGYSGGGRYDRCAGYYDVYDNDPYCDAIQWVTDQGIFEGYPDGMFRPNQAINRAETTKVVLVGFNYDILPSDGSNLGFWDVERNAWYMPYLRTAVLNGIVNGYPDGSFQPARVVNRVELLKIFLQSAGFVQTLIYKEYVPQPYPDTPVTNETRWYLPYVQFAKQYHLMDTDYAGLFNPNKPMTRGDVAELFYRFYQQNLDDRMSPYQHDNYNYDNNYNYNYYDPYYYDDNDDNPRVTSLTLSDYRLDEGQSMTINYTLNTCADITLEILDDDNDVVRELLDDDRLCSGRRSIRWNGEDDDGRDLRRGDYTVRIEADNNDGYDWTEMDFEIVNDNSNSNLEISELVTDTSKFDPDNDEVKITIKLNETAEVTIRIYDDENEMVRELYDQVTRSSSRFSTFWNGEDDYGDQVDDGYYTIKVYAENDDGGYDRDDIEVEVDDD